MYGFTKKSAEEFVEVLESDPCAAPDATGNFIIPESDLQTVNWHIMEEEDNQKSRQNKDIQLPVPVKITPELPEFAHSINSLNTCRIWPAYLSADPSRLS